jgi:hypothetical protein
MTNDSKFQSIPEMLYEKLALLTYSSTKSHNHVNITNFENSWDNIWQKNKHDIEDEPSKAIEGLECEYINVKKSVRWPIK